MKVADGRTFHDALHLYKFIAIVYTDWYNGFSNIGIF